MITREPPWCHSITNSTNPDHQPTLQVYKEEPIVMDSAIGAANLVIGGTRRLIGGASKDLGSIRTSARSITTLVQSEKY